ncbi:urease accessory protein UreE [Rhodococcus sp. IEGM 1330]|uniref:urease accessory protein UreE n=1 Tax=Rhodococcus sp. IEGM 1330 TaxID=3082225 RepID=UPI002953D19E|nr:urease accessory protein UreE [Rhodococcus sp. IEGM 1330]MDV8022368.1 urease accessory protein UreE [Rhodococcus sp. IEGM 1330]
MTSADIEGPVVESIVGHESDPALAEHLHRLRHSGFVEYVHIPAEDMDRTRLRVSSDAGRDYRIALGREHRVQDGSVLLLESERAVVVRAGEPRVLVLRATSVSAGLRLGFLAGHLHWKSSMTDDVVEVSMQGEVDDYLNRIAELVAVGSVEVQSQ